MVAIGQVYKTPSGKFLQVLFVKESGLHHFIEIQDNLNRIPVPEQRNKFGHVTRRTNLVYSEETISTFKKLKPL
jgi:hypothetical protein